MTRYELAFVLSVFKLALAHRQQQQVAAPAAPPPPRIVQVPVKSFLHECANYTRKLPKPQE